jgi:hypothetical protein
LTLRAPFEYWSSFSDLRYRRLPYTTNRGTGNRQEREGLGVPLLTAQEFDRFEKLIGDRQWSTQ